MLWGVDSRLSQMGVDVGVEYVAQRESVCESSEAKKSLSDMKARFAEQAGYMMRALGCT